MEDDARLREGDLKYYGRKIGVGSLAGGKFNALET